MPEPVVGAPDRAALEPQVLSVIARLVDELRRGEFRGAVGLGDSLERDLGISSLERVELLLRLERAFGVQLADAAMASADSPRDLVSAILTAEPAGAGTLPEIQAPVGAAAPAPASARTLVDVLRWHVEAHPDRTHIFLRQDDDQERAITYGELWQRANAVALGLRRRGLARHETVAIMLRTEAAFFFSFFGTLLAGGVPVPMYPPFRADRIEEYAGRQVALLRNAEARVMITFAQVERVAGLLRGRVPSLTAIVTVGDLTHASGLRPQSWVPSVWLTADDPTLIQYTSGSTGAPKGVLLSHGNVLANIRAIGQGLDIRPDDVAVSWLPLYHDMGLIGAWLGTLYFGTPVTILSPLAFLARPARWLWALHSHRGTMSPAPNFAFELCVRKVTDEEIDGLDLSCVRMLLNGSEAVMPDTIERFTQRFAPYGFKPEAMCPVYGLAECAVGLAIAPVGRPPRIDVIAREPFQQTGQAVPASSEDAAPLRFVSCGMPLPDHAIQIVDDTGRPVAERVEGAVLFRGPSVTRGYFRNPDATREVLRPGGWMDSGDLGYWAANELFLTGRRKDVIIKAGRNIYPQEVEELVGSLAGVRKGCVAAFGVDDPAIGTGRLVIVAETRETTADRRSQIQAAIIDHMASTLGIPPDTVLLGPPGSVLKTSSGKLRRSATREAYLEGRLTQPRRALGVQWARLLVQSVTARFSGFFDRSGSVVYTGYVIGLLVATLPVLWGLLLVTPRGRPADRLVRVWSRIALVLGGCRVQVEGREKLRSLETAVLVANHASYLDTLVLMAGLPIEFRFVAKRRLASYPLLGAIIRRVGHLTIERADLSQRMAGADQVVETLRQGTSLFIFPEGTFVHTPGLLPFRLGAFRAAVEAGRPVVPIVIRGTRRVFPAGTYLLRPGRVRLSIGTPIEPEGTGWPEMVRLRDLVRTEIAVGTGEDLGPRP